MHDFIKQIIPRADECRALRSESTRERVH